MRLFVRFFLKKKAAGVLTPDVRSIRLDTLTPVGSAGRHRIVPEGTGYLKEIGKGKKDAAGRPAGMTANKRRPEGNFRRFLKEEKRESDRNGITSRKANE